MDPPHLLKTISALANSYAHKKVRKLWKNNETLSWEGIEILFDITKKDTMRSHKLSTAHVELTAFSCMTVQYAAQVLRKSVATRISEAASHKRLRLDTSAS